MTFNEYQKQSRRFAIYPDPGKNIAYPTLGLTNEAGEVAGKIKKVFRDGNGWPNDEEKKGIADEIGDVLWYCAQLATELELPLSDIANGNIVKLTSRLERGKLGGNGDTR